MNKRSFVRAGIGILLAMMCLSGCETLKDEYARLGEDPVARALMDVAIAQGGVLGKSLEMADSLNTATDEFTPENEYYIGYTVAANILSRYTLADCPDMNRYLTLLANSIAATNDGFRIPMKGLYVSVLDSREINAFATCGGHILITRGFIECMENEDQLAAVIAHELSHIQLQHGIENIKSQRWGAFGKSTAQVLAEAAKLSDAKDEDTLVGFLLENADTLADMTKGMVDILVEGYSPEAEFAADANAYALLSGAGYNSSELFTMLKLIDASHQSSDVGMSKTHPKPKERIKRLTQVEKKSKAPAFPTDPARTERFLEHMSAL